MNSWFGNISVNMKLGLGFGLWSGFDLRSWLLTGLDEPGQLD